MLPRMSDATPPPVAATAVSRRTVPALWALGLAGAGVIIATVLLREHLTVLEGDVAGGLFCGGGGRFDCNAVAAHPSSWLLGLPLAAWGLAYYCVVAALALLAAPDGAEAAAAAGAGSVLTLAAVMLDAWLGWTMVTKIGAICMNCVATYVINAGLAVAFWRLDRLSEGARGWRALLLAWTGATRWLKLAALVLAIGGAGAALGYAAHAVGESAADARDEGTELLQRMATEPAIDMAPFAALPSEGPADARVTIVVASDFECSFCRAMAARLDDLRREFPRDVRVVFLNAPINPGCNPGVMNTEHRHACWLAKAGVCAARQGRFWEYHRRVYHTVPPVLVDEAHVRSGLGAAGIDAVALDRCLATADADSEVAREVRLWKALKMDSVPSLVINGHIKRGGIYPTTLRAVVRALLAPAATEQRR